MHYFIILTIIVGIVIWQLWSFFSNKKKLSSFENIFPDIQSKYEGAVRLDCHIGSDYYAPKRVQLNDTRLHANQGLKYADGHKWDADEELRKTVIDLQTLIDEASKDIPAPFTLEIVKDDGK
jgi:uncharacterized protein YpiB (UPF0302 family)